MNKLFVLVLMLLLLINVASALEYESGGIVELFSIQKCEGPVNIKATSENGIQADELRIEKCTNEENLWTCKCIGHFDVKLLTPDHVKNTYDFSIQYYTEYPDVKTRIKDITLNDSKLNDSNSTEVYIPA